MNIAIIGAGISGLACARRLGAGGHRVTVFERDDVPGGRVATTKSEVGGFDDGAQYLTARDPSFVAEVEAWSRAGIVEPWPVVAHAIGARAALPADRATRRRPPSAGYTLRWVGVPGMATIATHLADGLDVRYDARIVALDPVDADRTASPRWALRRVVADLGTDGASGPIMEGLFDAVIVALPAETATVLLGPAPSLARQAAAARIEPCWALLLGFAGPIAADPDVVGNAAFVEGGRLAWIARESSKPERRVGERWTVHAQSAWSVEHFDDDPEDVKAKLLRAFHDATGTIEQPVYATVHRWRHALARTSLSCDFLWDNARRVGACGDWCRGYRIEDAWLSGVALAHTLMTQLTKS